MSKCDVCGQEESMPYQCHHCGGTYCAEHRLPEAHDCPGLQNWGNPDPVFDSGFDDSVDDGDSGGLLSGLSVGSRRGGLTSYFRGNMTYVFLGLMWITFLAQQIVGNVYGFQSDIYRSIFVLTVEDPEYVWTWFTSVFSHAPDFLMHIAFNSLAVYFFGRIVEDYIGTKRFTYLFLGSGVLAGLAQIGFIYVQYFADLRPELTGGVLGASGAAFALMGVVTIVNPNLRIFLFPIPVPIKVWMITGFYVLISVFGIFAPGSILGFMANAAHLVGLVIGLWYGKRVEGRRRPPSQMSLGGSRGPGGPGRGGGRF